LRNSDTPAREPAEDLQEAVPAAGPEDDSGPTAAARQSREEAAALTSSNALQAPESQIQELRKHYLQKSYKVDAKALSSKIIDEHLLE
jgi:anti-sigma28 factor (negative regulator of flagellin synthesis)